MATISRRAILKGGGAMVVSFAIGRQALAQARAAHTVDSFLAIHQDGSVTIFTSHVDIGTGISTVFRQVAAEELDIPVERFTVIEGDTATTPDHGGTGGSTGVPRGAADIRRAAATAREAIIALAAKQVNRPESELSIEAGEVRPGGISVASLIGGKRFALKVNPNAKLKERAQYTTVGKPILRTDVPLKCTGRQVYLQD